MINAVENCSLILENQLSSQIRFNSVNVNLTAEESPQFNQLTAELKSVNTSPQNIKLKYHFFHIQHMWVDVRGLIYSICTRAKIITAAAGVNQSLVKPDGGSLMLS